MTIWSQWTTDAFGSPPTTVQVGTPCGPEITRQCQDAHDEAVRQQMVTAPAIPGSLQTWQTP